MMSMDDGTIRRGTRTLRNIRDAQFNMAINRRLSWGMAEQTAWDNHKEVALRFMGMDGDAKAKESER